ncbi:MAG: CRISPR-associated helicase Cas3' [Pseudoramibacter sp.]
MNDDKCLETLEEALWAKSEPYKKLFVHMRESALTAQVLLTQSSYSDMLGWLSEDLGLPKKQALALIMYLTGMHDIGKCHPMFQEKIDQGTIGDFFKTYPKMKYMDLGYRHELGSQVIAERIWKKNQQFGKHMPKNFSAILSLHHQGKHGKPCDLDRYRRDWPEAKIWMEAQEHLENRLRDWLNPPKVDRDQMKNVDAVCMMIMGIVILSDWLSSSEVLENTSGDEPDQTVQDQMKAFLDQTGMNAFTPIAHTSFHDMWASFDDEDLRPLQKSLQNYLQNQKNMPIAMILEAPMGEGKTEAGLYAACCMADYWHKKGVYIGLPTAATSNQMIGRVNALLEAHHAAPAHLLHSMAWLYESEGRIHVENVADQNAAENWLMSSKRKMLLPVSVGTVDQVMMAALRVKYGILRLLGLENKVLIIDEIHAYDAYMSDIIQRLLQWCKVLEIPVIMLSATLPSSKKAGLLEACGGDEAEVIKGYPQITAVFEDKDKPEVVQVPGSYQKSIVTIKLSQAYREPEQIAALAQEKVKDGGCICVLVNTVKKAQQIYQALKESRQDESLMLFHSRFSAARRKEIEDTCLKCFGGSPEDRPSKAILIATQVVEQSLDVDFDTMITEIAPVDLILQRLGRMHRHAETKRPANLQHPELTVLVPPDDEYDSSGFIYYPILLTRTRKQLESISEIHIPEDIPSLVEAVYYDEPDEEELEAFTEKLFDEQLESGKAEGVELREPHPRTFNLQQNSNFFDDDEDTWVAAKTRLGEETVRLAILPQRLFDHLKDMPYIGAKNAAKVVKYSVSVSKKSVLSLQEAFKNQDICIEGSGRLTGLCMLRGDMDCQAPEETMTVQLNGFVLRMDREMGFMIERE